MIDLDAWAKAFLHKQHAQCKKHHYPFKCPKSDVRMLTDEVVSVFKQNNYGIPPPPTEVRFDGEHYSIVQWGW